jgi:carbamoyltransferase
MNILGLVSETHDTGLAVLQNGRIECILEEERHSREKHTREFPVHSLRALFGDDGRKLADIDLITLPWDEKRIRRTFASAILRRFPASLNLVRAGAHPTQEIGVPFLRYCVRRDFKRAFPDAKLPPMVNVGHHESHAAMFFVSPFDDATVIVMDGYGDDAATSVFTGQGNRLKRVSHGRFFDSLGILYTLVTTHLGFQPFEEGTVMALASLGSDRLVERMRNIVHLGPDGSFSVNMDYFSYDKYGLIRPFTRKFLDAFGPPRRRADPLTDYHRDLAHALQTVAEEVVMHVVRAARKTLPSRNLCLVGGVALNCVANARVLRESGFENIWVPPCASDTGAPLGSALWHWHSTLGKPRSQTLTHAFHGLSYDDRIETVLKSEDVDYQRIAPDELIGTVARDLADGRIVGWYQGRYEIGPRALGNRSILASPLQAGVRDVMNARVKFREPFRPFAPAVLEERASEFFDIGQSDPFMTTAPRVKPGMAERIPAAVHVDGTARVQTVERSANPRYYDLIEGFGRLSGVPVLINTSFNKQEPIVATPEEALSCFLRTDMDVLVMGNTYTRDRPAEAMRKARSSFEVIEVNTRSGE